MPFGFEKIRFRVEKSTKRSQEFSAKWQEFLSSTYRHYWRLPDDLKIAFNAAAHKFLMRRRIAGIEVEVTEELKLLVAASAVTLSLCWERYEWHQLSEILLYRDYFDRDYNFGGTERAGTVDHWGTVILSVPALRHSFETPGSSYHVGLHEFAHVLDLDGSRADGIPPGLTSAEARLWVQMQNIEMENIRVGRSVLDPYGMTDEVEFFAVSVETFFQAPVAMRDGHHDLYFFLSRYFDQDPAHWEDQANTVS